MSIATTDQLGNAFVLPSSPRRIVSLVPSITELIFDLCPVERIVGRTKFCTHPEKHVADIPRIGGTKNIHVDKLKELKPDIVFANKEENQKKDVEEIRRFCPVWVSDVPNLDAAHRMIREMGSLLGSEKKAAHIIKEQERLFDHRISERGRKVVYLIWYRPLMTVGSDTYIHDIMKHLGLDNLFGDRTRYPETSIEEIRQLRPEMLL